MSPSQVAPPRLGRPPLFDSLPAPRRPGTLLALQLAGVGAALTGVAGSFRVFSGGRNLAETNTRELLHYHPELLNLPPGRGVEEFRTYSGPLWDELVSDRHAQLTSRAGLVVGVAVLLLAFTWLSQRAVGWARALLTCTGAVALVPHLLIVTDAEPDSVTAFSYAAMVCSLAVLACCWLPANNRYARDLKTSR